MISSLRPEDVVVLDVDDTLYLERDYVRSGFAVVGDMLASEYGIEGVGETLWAGFLRGVRGDAFNRALAVHAVDDESLVPAMVALYRSHYPSIGLQADAASLLDRIAGLRSAVITDGPVDSQQNKVDALGLATYTDKVILTGALGPDCGKPSPVSYVLVEDHFDVRSQQCWYIADNPAKDFVTPLNRGWTSIRIRRPDSLHVNMATPDGVHEVVTLDEIAISQPG